jgi:hypothetical protein
MTVLARAYRGEPLGFEVAGGARDDRSGAGAGSAGEPGAGEGGQR